jgi:hypothetical protein
VYSGHYENEPMLRPDDGVVSIKLSRVEADKVYAILYRGAWKDELCRIYPEYKDRLYNFTLPKEFLRGDEYVMDIYHDASFLKGLEISTDEVVEEIEPDISGTFTLDKTRKATISVLEELDALVANGYYYNESLLIPSNIVQQIIDLSRDLRDLSNDREGVVAQKAYILRHELSLLKTQISSDNETIRRWNMRTKKIPISPREAMEISTSVGEMVANALNDVLGGNNEN